MPWIETGETVYAVENDNISDDWTVFESRMDAIAYIRDWAAQRRAEAFKQGDEGFYIDELEKEAIREIIPKPKRIWRD